MASGAAKDAAAAAGEDVVDFFDIGSFNLDDFDLDLAAEDFRDAYTAFVADPGNKSAAGPDGWLAGLDVDGSTEGSSSRNSGVTEEEEEGSVSAYVSELESNDDEAAACPDGEEALKEMELTVDDEAAACPDSEEEPEEVEFVDDEEEEPEEVEFVDDEEEESEDVDLVGDEEEEPEEVELVGDEEEEPEEVDLVGDEEQEPEEIDLVGGDEEQEPEEIDLVGDEEEGPEEVKLIDEEEEEPEEVELVDEEEEEPEEVELIDDEEEDSEDVDLTVDDCYRALQAAVKDAAGNVDEESLDAREDEESPSRKRARYE